MEIRGKQMLKNSIWVMIFGIVLLDLMLFRSFAAIKTGGIDVELFCYEEDGKGHRRTFEKSLELMPKEEISYVLTVKNQGSDAWIRMKILFIEKNETILEETPNVKWMYGISEDWIEKGGYWYYTKPLKKNTEVDFCKGIQIPDIHYLTENLRFSVTARAEAVQKIHTSPDFTQEQPFSGMLIEDSVGYREEESVITGFEVQYENGADTIVHADKLFADVDAFMPGDIVTQKVVVENKNQSSVRIKIKETGEKTEDIVLKALNLTIRRGTSVLYRGAFEDFSLKNGIVLGEFPGNSREELEFELSLSKEAKNETAFCTIPIAVVFSVEQTAREDVEIGEEAEEKKHPQMYACPDPSVSEAYRDGQWILIHPEKNHWEYRFADGSKAKNGWMYLYNPYSANKEKKHWFCFSPNGVMQFGWIRTENHNWYFCHERSDGSLGELKRGWHSDQDDKKQYYLDPVTGIMQTGWRKIEGNYYYFTPLEHTQGQSWFWNTGIGRWLYEIFGYRTYGSMYRNEKTPDGYSVDDNGVWNEQEELYRKIC